MCIYIYIYVHNRRGYKCVHTLISLMGCSYTPTDHQPPGRRCLGTIKGRKWSRRWSRRCIGSTQNGGQTKDNRDTKRITKDMIWEDMGSADTLLLQRWKL